MFNSRVRDFTGQRFGRLVALRPSKIRKGSNFRWICKCDCGNETVVINTNLVNGSTNSCGCYRREFSKLKHTTHGWAGTKTHRAWRGMLTRCYNPNVKCYKHYGGRGIKVCRRWRNSFKAFLIDMGPAPKNRSLDRKDNNGNYEPGNCHWATAIQQRKNQRRSKKGK